jgi:hypothetical protein
LLSVLEGHPNFYKSGARVGGLRLHYKDVDSLSGLSDGNMLGPTDPKLKSLWAKDSSKVSDEPGLEVDLLGADAFPTMSWLQQYNMHMYRWAGNEKEWTEYALRLRHDIARYLESPSVNDEDAGPGTKPFSILDSIRNLSGCKITIKTDKLRGKDEIFLVLVRGSNGSVENTAFESALELVNQALHDELLGSAVKTEEVSSRVGDDGRVHRVIDLPMSAVNIIKGSAGKKLQSIRKKSGAFVSLITKFKGKGPAKMNITGSAQSVKLAVNLLRECLKAEES